MLRQPLGVVGPCVDRRGYRQYNLPNLTRAGRAPAKPAAKTRRKPVHNPLSDLRDILDRFGRALTIVTVARIAIEASEQLALEECALQQGIAELDAVYNELDLAIGAFSRRGAAENPS